MKKVKKYIIVFLIIIFEIINYCTVNAGFADYSDEDAKKESEKLIEEHQKSFDTSKSNNNFLSDLKIEGYELSPNFDKQILEYILNKELNTKEINIIAICDDENAKVDGDGKINLEDEQQECRIDVTAESGTVRTYIIKINAVAQYKNDVEENASEDKSEEIEENENIENIIDTVAEVNNEQNVEQIEENNIEENNYNKKTIVIVCVIIVVLLMICLVLKKKTNKNKSKHSK